MHLMDKTKVSCPSLLRSFAGEEDARCVSSFKKFVGVDKWISRISSHGLSWFATKRHSCSFDIGGSKEKQRANQINFCQIDGVICPITQNNLQSFLGMNAHHDGLCNLFATMAEPLRIIAFGGSATAGADANGCCCKSALDKERCPLSSQNTCGNSCIGNKSEGNHPFLSSSLTHPHRHYHGSSSLSGCEGRGAPSCTWLARLYRFVSSYFSPRRVELIDLSKRATSSPWAGSMLQSSPDVLVDFTAQDLVFIDYSVNDALVFRHNNSDLTQMVLQDGLETLIRQLLRRKRHDFSPAIVLLEQFPFHTNQGGRGEEKTGDDYRIVYQRIAKHYALPLWSYRNATHFDDQDLKDLISFQRQPGGFWQHPRWPLHLYHADLIGAALLETLQRCQTMPGNQTKQNISLSSNQGYHRNYTIPPPLRQQSMMLCASGENPILGHHSAVAAAAAVVALVSNASGSGPSVWTISVSNNSTWKLDSLDHGQPGWIATLSSTQINDRQIAFAFSLPTNVTTDESISVVLNVEYLRTYEDAGMVEFSACGKVVASLDALWKHSATTLSPLYSLVTAASGNFHHQQHRYHHHYHHDLLLLLCHPMVLSWTTDLCSRSLIQCVQSRMPKTRFDIVLGSAAISRSWIISPLHNSPHIE